MTTITWRTGANIRELAFYGARGQQDDHPEVVKNSSDVWAEQQLQSLQNIGVQVIRFYAAHQWFSAAATIALVKKTLDLIAAHHMQAIVCLNDSLGDRLFNVHGDEAFHTEAGLGHLRGNYWTQGAYEDFYIPHITKVVTAFRSHKAVLMWELGNEYGIYPDPANANQVKAFLKFANVASSTIKNIAPQQLVSTGLINTHHIESSGGDIKKFSQSLHSLRSIDAISLHYYADKNNGQDSFNTIDVDVATTLVKKPFYIGEFGAEWQKFDRPAFYQEKIKEWKDRGAKIVMPWAYDDVARPNPAVTDVGIGDPQGLSRAHGDFNTLIDIVKSFRGNDPLVTLSHTGGASFEAAAGDAPQGGVIAQEQIQPFAQAQTYRVTEDGNDLHVRTSPDKGVVTQPGTSDPILLLTNDTIVADARFKTDKYFWLRHSQGWSAERTVDDMSVFLELMTVSPVIRDFPRYSADIINVNTLPFRDALFERLPVQASDINWIQYFGNTMFAFTHGKTENYDAYSQGLHGGLDLGNSSKEVPVYAGVNGTILKSIGKFGPRNVVIQTKGGYRIVYGHLKQEAPLVDEGKIVDPTTRIGSTELVKEQHLHLEIRYKPAGIPDLILNPLLFMPEALRIIINGKSSGGFYSSPTWQQWITPYGQPIIVRGGPVIGPRAT